MKRPPLVVLTTSFAALAAVALAAPPAPAPLTAPGPPLDAAHLAQSKSLFSEKCSACHNLPNPDAQGYTRVEWQRTVNEMLTRYHASDEIAPAEAAQIVDYLATFAPKIGQLNRSGDPWGTNPDDVPTVAPTLSRVFNFEAPDALASFGTLAAGGPGPVPVWSLVTASASPDGTAAQVRPLKPSPTRFALLMDRRDQARNVDIKVRFRIAAGKVTPAVGIVFGFAGPKSYDVLAYNQARNDLSLIQIAEPTHTTLQQTPIVLPSAGALTASQTTPPPAPANGGWHTLRLLVKDGQVRGWLDMTKRISAAAPTYQGGKVGLWAQGDTIAAFDDWTVDVYDSAPSPAPPGA